MTHPAYHIEGPALISFSGGRTSAYLLFKIVEAHGGSLPDDVVVAFANTGKERPETLRFVQQCGESFGVRIRWLEWRDRSLGFEEVGPNSASRNGEPFDALIRKKKRLPNWQERWCTSFLKLKPLFGLAAVFGWQPGQYAEVIGLRHDEGHRIFKGLANAEKEGRNMVYPLAKAKATKRDVMEFWLGQNQDPCELTHPLPLGFDLGLRDYEGNCDYCPLKGRGIKKRQIREGKADPTWWAQKEIEQNGFFDRRDTIAELIEECRRAPDMFESEPDDFDYDVECGLTCGLPEAPTLTGKDGSNG